MTIYLNDDANRCPFCNSQKAYLTVLKRAKGPTEGHFVKCDDCKASGPLKSNAIAASAAWQMAFRVADIVKARRDEP